MTFKTKFLILFSSAVVLATSSVTAEAFGSGLFAKMRGGKSGNRDAVNNEYKLNYQDRDMYIHVPKNLPPEGQRALVVALHGGLGNAERIVAKRSEHGLNLDDVADKYGFIVAYMNGTPVTKMLGSDKRGWNAGQCCGQSAEKNIDDVAYISSAVGLLADKYAINPGKVYGIGHSNGAMMTQRIICESGLYAAGVSISGALEIEVNSCPGARGRKILEIHGQGDKNVPIEGGLGQGISRKYPKKSQEYSQQVFNNSGAEYILQVLPDAAHNLGTIEEAIEKQEGISLQEKISRFFGLAN